MASRKPADVASALKLSEGLTAARERFDEMEALFEAIIESHGTAATLAEIGARLANQAAREAEELESLADQQLAAIRPNGGDHAEA